MTLQPLYTTDNCRVAYQLNWSLTLFASTAWQPTNDRFKAIAAAVESDDVRILEHRSLSPDSVQLLLSTKPTVAPAATIRSVKGRWQYLLREQFPKLWRRHYHIASVGETNNQSLHAYVGRQIERHQPADSRIAARLSQYQFVDERVDLSTDRASSHGRFIHNLHIVLETAEHLPDVREPWLATTRDMLVKACEKKGWLLARVGIVANHAHIMVGVDIASSPSDVVLSLMNNLAFAHGMKRVFEPSYYVGTFGCYDRNAIRRQLS